MAKINLLPPDLGPNASVLKFLSLAQKIAVLIGITFFIGGTLLAGYIVFLRMEITASEKSSQAFKSSITALTTTEQKLFLLKERVGNIKKLLAKQTQGEPLANSRELLLNHQGVILTKVSTSLGKLTISGSSPNTSSLGDFFESIFADNNFKNVKLTSFLFNPKSGYLFSLDLNLK